MKRKSKNVTIKDSTDKFIIKLQTELIKSSNINWSYSKVTDLILQEGIDFLSSKGLSNLQVEDNNLETEPIIS